MRSVADQLREELRARMTNLSGAERVEMALRLGDEDLDAFARARALGRDAALRALQRARQAGRRQSACVQSLLA